MIRLIDAAKHYRDLPHQRAAFEYLQDQVDKTKLEEFASIYRSAVPDKADKVGNDWTGIANAARKAGAKFPELVAAQWALESGWGKHQSGANNYWGLKGSGTSHETQEFVNGKWITITDSFIDFPSLQAGVTYLVDRWYKDWRGYKGVNNANTAEDGARWLVKEGYATDPDYASKLVALLRKNTSKPAATKLQPGSSFALSITPNVTYGELTLQSEARRFTAQYQCDTAVMLCQFVQKARDHFNKPAVITSAHRPHNINAQTGGAPNSEHLYDAPDKGAIDFYLDGMSVLTLQEWVDAHWSYSVGYGARLGFVHLGIRPGKQRVRWNY